MAKKQKKKQRVLVIQQRPDQKVIGGKLITHSVMDQLSKLGFFSYGWLGLAHHHDDDLDEERVKDMIKDALDADDDDDLDVPQITGSDASMAFDGGSTEVSFSPTPSFESVESNEKNISLELTQLPFPSMLVSEAELSKLLVIKVESVEAQEDFVKLQEGESTYHLPRNAEGAVTMIAKVTKGDEVSYQPVNCAFFKR